MSLKEVHMAKTYSDIALDLILKDWKSRKKTNRSYYTQERISKLMRISRTRVSRVLSGDLKPDFDFVCSYATAVGMNIESFLCTIAREILKVQEEELIQKNEVMVKRETKNRMIVN